MNPVIGLVPVLLATAAAAGQVTTDFAGGRDTAYGVAVQADGRIVAVGSSNGGFALARYTATGALDTSFGGTGRVTTAIPGVGATARRVAVLADGRILVAGERLLRDSIGELTGDLVLARYRPDGTLDPGFGTGGVTITDVAGANEALTDMAVQPDGRIVVVGSSQQWSSATMAEFLVARYTADGVLDTSFGTGGTMTTDFFGRWDGARGVAVQADGRIVVAGQADQLVGSFSVFTRFTLARYTSAGALDPTFGTGGKVATNVDNGWGTLADLAIQGDGRILATGRVQNSGMSVDIALIRYTSAGALDPTFGTGGIVRTDRANGQEDARALLIHPAGRIVVAGSSETDFALVGYRTDGSLDPGFGVRGIAITDFGSIDQGHGVVVQGDGKIVTLGDTGGHPGTTIDFALTRHTAAGVLDTSFG